MHSNDKNTELIKLKSDARWLIQIIEINDDQID